MTRRTLTRSRVLVVVSALGTAAVLLGSAVLDGVSSEETSALSDDVSLRPGARLGSYMGLDIPPSTWRELSEPYLDSVNGCMTAATGRTEVLQPVTVRPAQELRVADPEEFGSRYFYGLTDQLASEAEAASQPLPGGPLSDEEQVALQWCESSAGPLIDALAAPRAVHQRYGELLEAAAHAPRYQATAAAWSACLATQGVQASNPISIPESVTERAMELFDMSSAAASTEGFESTEAVIHLDRNALEELHAYESAVYASDQKCRESTGLETVMYQIETEILDQLQKEFPAFGGVHRG